MLDGGKGNSLVGTIFSVSSAALFVVWNVQDLTGTMTVSYSVCTCLRCNMCLADSPVVRLMAPELSSGTRVYPCGALSSRKSFRLQTMLRLAWDIGTCSLFVRCNETHLCKQFVMKMETSPYFIIMSDPLLIEVCALDSKSFVKVRLKLIMGANFQYSCRIGSFTEMPECIFSCCHFILCWDYSNDTRRAHRHW